MSSDLTAMPTRCVGGVTFAVSETARVAEAIRHDALEGETGLAIHFANAYTVALAHANSAVAKILHSSKSLNITDGAPVTWFGRRYNRSDELAWEQMSGPDVMARVLAESNADGPRHFLLGGSRETLEQLQVAIAKNWPQAIVVGAESPPYRSLTEQELAEQDQRIRASGANIVWVGLGTPKQDFEVDRLAQSIPIIACGVGAAFDFIAGTKKRSPAWMTSAGLEWVYRLAQEPRRLAGRYLWGNPRFVMAAIKYRDRPAFASSATDRQAA
jgi:N-acetylglucosaminyldiphosphoundecaprenol N-acetyl-beta-D-mannosaminyltransferase